jgi:CHAD domain-containing protein
MAKALPLFAVDPDGPLAANAPLMLHTRLEELYRYAGCVGDESRVEELHNMRIAAKRLRYTMEIYAPCFPGKEFANLYDDVKKVQERIGDLHDADVRIPKLQQFLDTRGAGRPELQPGLQSLIASQTAARKRGYRSFVAYWNRLQTSRFRQRFLQLLVIGETTMAMTTQKGTEDIGD